jgi:UDP-glucose 4-epimerase
LSIMITGAAGYIGSHVAAALCAAGHDVVLFDNLSSGRFETVEALEQICGKRPAFVRGDVKDAALVSRTFELFEVEAVIHCAGLKSVADSFNKPLEYFDNNVLGSIQLLNAMQVSGVRTIVFSSSATVYGLPSYLPIDERHPTQVNTPYGRSKCIVEEILADLANSESSWRICRLRYFNPVGAHDTGLIGEDPDGVPTNLLPIIARVATGELDHLEIFGDDYNTPDGTGVRDYVHVMDLAEGHVAALRYVRAMSPGVKTYNLGTGRGYSVLEMIKAFEVASGCSIASKVVSRRAGDVGSCYADVSSAASELNWRACRSVADMCESAWRFQIHRKLNRPR